VNWGDGAGKGGASAALSFTMPATIFTATDTTVADFSGGTLDGNVYIAQSADGEVILQPTAGSEFFGAALPVDWSSTPWNAGGAATVSAGSLVVDGARAGTIASFSPGRSIEFVATFSGAAFQHVGFADTLEGAPWAIFSTFGGGTTLYARTSSGGSSIDTPIAGSLRGTPHRFRVDWSAASVVYSVDGAIVATHAIALAGPLRPLVSDFAAAGGAVGVDWLRMTPYASAGTFLSRGFGGGAPVNWGSLSWTAAVPAGTAVSFSVRRGNTPSPDASWTPFSTIPFSGGAIGGTSRFLQYRVDVSTTDVSTTPAVEQVTIGYS